MVNIIKRVEDSLFHKNSGRFMLRISLVAMVVLFSLGIAYASGVIGGGSSGGDMQIGRGTVVAFTQAGPHNWTVPEGVHYVDVLVIGGGGSGGGRTSSSGGWHSGGGGGGGGIIFESNFSVSGLSNIDVVVGAGGIPTPRYSAPNSDPSRSGGNSGFHNLIAIGGGGGGDTGSSSACLDGLEGGGGGGAGTCSSIRSGGSGTINQGNDGGSGRDSPGLTGDNLAAGGGTGSSGNSPGGAGGDGGYYGDVFGDNFGENGHFSGGGAGGSGTTSAYASGGVGGGGDGGGNTDGEDAMPNTGGGGGGGSRDYHIGGSGGSGIVLIRYGGKAKTASTESGLVGHWSLDENFYDSSTNEVKDRTPYDNHGTPEGGIIIGGTTDRMGQPNMATVFTGDPLTSHINIPKPIEFQDNEHWSINLWVYRQNPPGVDRGGIGNRGYPTISFQDNRAIFWLWDDTYISTNLYYGFSITDSWHMLTFTMNKNNNITLYVDGEEKDSGTVLDSSFRIRSIGSGNTGDRPFKGFMNDIRVYDRLLSENEIKSLYESYRPKLRGDSLGAGLVGHWPLTDKWSKDNNGVLTDRTPYSNDGTNHGATITSDGAEFDGVSDYVDLGENKVFSITDWTISSWFKSSSTGTLQHFTGLDNRESNTNWIAIYNNKLALWIHQSGDPNRGWHYGDTVLENNKWYHMTLAYDGKGNYEFFLNGESDTTNWPTFTEELDEAIIRYIGSYESPPNRIFNGLIDDVKIYNRALSESEIELLYARGR